jgi:hypothetical protein
MTSFFKATLELKSMQFWLGQNFTYFYTYNFSDELAPNPILR